MLTLYPFWLNSILSPSNLYESLTVGSEKIISGGIEISETADVVSWSISTIFVGVNNSDSIGDCVSFIKSDVSVDSSII